MHRPSRKKIPITNSRSQFLQSLHWIALRFAVFPSLSFLQMRLMTSRELRKQRREAERKARKLAYQQSRVAAASAQETCGAGSLAGEPVARPADFAPGERSSFALAPNPDLFDEFSAEEQMEMMAIRARVHARAALPDTPQAQSPSERTGPTGPTTPEGKAISSGNSLKHGLASGRVIIPGENPAEFEALLSDLIKEHAPANETESLLVQQMAQSWWLMQRAIRIQRLGSARQSAEYRYE